MLAGLQGSKDIPFHMGFSAWDQLHLPRDSLLKPRQETSGHKNKLRIVKPKATHHHRLPPMAWSVSQVPTGVSQGLGGLEQSQQKGLSQTGCCRQSCAQRLPAMCDTQNKAALIENLALIVPFTCWPAWEPSSVQSPMSAVCEHDLRLYVPLGKRGSLENSAPVGS